MRTEFSKKTKRAALERSEMKCEAIGKFYGLEEGQRCNAPLSFGVQFDHVVADAIGGDNSLENCAAVCLKCHGFKTAKHDTPAAAKGVRIRDKNAGIKAKKQPIRSAGFPKAEREPKRLTKQLPPRRALYAQEQ